MTALILISKSLMASVEMFWSILWALILGFFLSAVTMTFIPKTKIASSLGRPGVGEIALAAFLGAISSSCSYAAASMSRSLFQRGAHIITALAFLLASTNLVIEMSVILYLMMGWQFVVAEFMGGIILVGIMAVLMRLFAPLEAFANIRLSESHEPAHHGHGNSEAGTVDKWRSLAGAFVSEWKMIWKDIAVGMAVSGFLMVMVPDWFWQSLFLRTDSSHMNDMTAIHVLENALIGPLVSMMSFVCSIGNIPLAGVLYHGGIGFGGALSFIYADLIIIPLILVYRKYFGNRLALWITGIFYVSMVLTGIVVDLIFRVLGWIPDRASMPMTEAHGFSLNYTFWLNLAFLGLAGYLLYLSKSGPKSVADCCHHSPVKSGKSDV